MVWFTITTGGRGLVVRIRERAAAEQRNAHGFKIGWFDVVEEERGRLLAAGERLAVESNRAGFARFPPAVRRSPG